MIDTIDEYVERMVKRDTAAIQEAALEVVLTGIQTTVELHHGTATAALDEDGKPHIYLDLHS